MPRQLRVIIADRSELAANLYRLLLSPLGANLVVRKRFEEARPHFFRREKVDLGIFNSNVFGKKFPMICRQFEEIEPLGNLKKLFVCGENPSDEHIRDRLMSLNNSSVLTKPFHPEEFSKLVNKILGFEG